MKFAIIIPARYQSSRFPGKPLAKINNKTLIEHVYEKCLKFCDKKNIFVATDNNKISKFLKSKKINFIITSKKCLTGTDRIAEANKKIKANIIINVQGDEPMILASDIKKIFKAKIINKNMVICGYNQINYSDALNKNVPKVLFNKKKELIYMSRSIIPSSKNNKYLKKYYRQVCIYAFNKKELEDFYKLKKKTLYEKSEDIELLRYFDINKKIKMIKLSNNSLAVDIPRDIKKVEQKLNKK